MERRQGTSSQASSSFVGTISFWSLLRRLSSSDWPAIRARASRVVGSMVGPPRPARGTTCAAGRAGGRMAGRARTFQKFVARCEPPRGDAVRPVRSASSDLFGRIPTSLGIDLFVSDPRKVASRGRTGFPGLGALARQSGGHAMNHTLIPLACRPELLLSPLPDGEPGRYAVKDLRTGDCYTLGQREYFLLARLDGEQTAAGLCRAFQEQFGESLSHAELDEFVELARSRGFLQPCTPEQAPVEDDILRAVRDESPPATSDALSDPDCTSAEVCRYDEVPYVSRPFP